jgi:hypothetical protein
VNRHSLVDRQKFCRPGRWWLFLLWFGWAARSALAVILFSTADPEHNTTPPAGALSGSGWELQGLWGPFLGTPIAPHYFITAQHVGGSPGDLFFLNGASYMALQFFDDPSSDLRIWQVDGTFSAYAPLYDGASEVGQTFIVHGRGTQRGDSVTVAGAGPASLRGWRWGTADGRLRWGQNQVAGIQDGNLAPLGSGSTPKIGALLKAFFKSSGGPDEAHLSSGDSGGGMFILDGGVWKLAGINYSVDGPYSLTNAGPGFDAALFDTGGLYTEGKSGWVLKPESGQAQPSSFYATRISAHRTWINSVLGQPYFGIPVLQSAASPAGPYTDEAAAGVDIPGRRIVLPIPAAPRFYRLRAEGPLQVVDIHEQGGNLILSYK